MHYIKQLDSLRAIAVLLVIITHWFPEGHPVNTYTSFFNGVDIFFVLSGFLITRILLENRKEAESLGNSKWHICKNFYVRRFLRIFPIYYAAIFVLFLLGPKTGTHIRENVVYFLTYTSNFYFIHRGKWEGMLSHLWSLSVEEQFYLLWPWLILFIRKKFLLPLIGLSILVGITGQFFYSELATFSCFDGFGLGALLAWAIVYRPDSLSRFYKPLLGLAAISCLLQVARGVNGGDRILLPSRTLTAFCTIAVIAAILLGKGKDSVLSRFVLNNKVLVFIGKISYGIYLYHLMVPLFVSKTLEWANEHLFPGLVVHNSYVMMVVDLCILLAGAYISWKVIEQPILGMKRNFAYQKLPAISKGEVRVISPAQAVSKAD